MRKSRFTDEQVGGGSSAKRTGTRWWRSPAARDQRADDRHAAEALRWAADGGCAPAAVAGGRERTAEEAGGGARPRDRGDERGCGKKLVSVPVRRKQVVYGRERGLSVRRAVLGCPLGAAVSWPEGCQGWSGDRADAGAVGAVSTLRLPAHPDFSAARRPRDERWSGVSAVAAGEAAGFTQTGPQACGVITATSASTCKSEPGMELRLRVRPLRQRPAVEVPDGDRRVHQGRLSDRRRRVHPLATRD